MPNQRLSNKLLVERVIRELRKRNIGVSLPVIKSKTVSCVVKNGKGKLLTIKVRGRIPRWIFAFGAMEPRPDYYFILYAPDKNYYVVPSKVIYQWLMGKEKMFIKKEYREILDSLYKNKFSLLS